MKAKYPLGSIIDLRAWDLGSDTAIFKVYQIHSLSNMSKGYSASIKSWSLWFLPTAQQTIFRHMIRYTEMIAYCRIHTRSQWHLIPRWHVVDVSFISNRLFWLKAVLPKHCKKVPEIAALPPRVSIQFCLSLPVLPRQQNLVSQGGSWSWCYQANA